MRRFSITYETPDGERRLSSSTRKAALRVADQVDARDVNADAVGRGYPHRLTVKVVARGDQPTRDDPVAQDLLFAVDVVEVGLERLDPLGDSLLEPGPLRRGDHPRDEIKREWPLLAGQGERDALIDEGTPQRVGAGRQLRGVRWCQLGEYALVGATNVALGVEHLVKGLRIAAQAVVAAENPSWRTGFGERVRDDCVVSAGSVRRLTIDMLHQLRRFGRPESVILGIYPLRW